MQSKSSSAQSLCDLISQSFLTDLTIQEKSDLDDLGVRNEHGYLPGAARIKVRGCNIKMIVSNPHVVCENLIHFYTPTEQEAACVLPLNVIDGVFFSE
jgi:hypothetical protein